MRFLFLLTVAVTAVVAQSPFEAVEKGGTWIDLTYEFSEDTIYWPTARCFELKTEFEGMTDKGYYYAANQFCASEHGGTHIDAPIHFSKGMQTVSDIPLERLMGMAAVVDVSAKAETNPDYQVSVEDFKAWEEKNGRIQDGAMVLLRTGFGKHWPDRKTYMGTSELGEGAVPKLRFPGLDPKAAEWLVENRSIGCIGLDTPSIDFGQSTHFESHQILFKANIPALENVAYLEKLPTIGAFVMALPIKIKGGSGGPTRIVAWVPNG